MAKVNIRTAPTPTLWKWAATGLHASSEALLTEIDNADGGHNLTLILIPSSVYRTSSAYTVASRQAARNFANSECCLRFVFTLSSALGHQLHNETCQQLLPQSCMRLFVLLEALKPQHGSCVQLHFNMGDSWRRVLPQTISIAGTHCSQLGITMDKEPSCTNTQQIQIQFSRIL